MKRPPLAVLIVLSVVSVPVAAARQDSARTIPKDLVELLLSDYGTRLTITEGMPRDVPPELVPDGGTARIALSTPGLAMVIAEVPQFDSSARPRFDRKLAAAGWVERSQPGSYSRGLAPSSAGWTIFCREDRYVTYQVLPPRGDQRWVKVSMMRAQRDGPCTESDARYPPRTSIFDDERMPRLTPPEASRVADWGGGGGGDVVEQRLRLETDLSEADVADHYASQLIAHGWKVASRASTDGMTLVRFDAMLAPNEPITLTIDTMRLPSRNVSVGLKAFDTRARRP